ncbi:dihydroxy-acid dehydratase [Streptomyces sp. NPDC007875]|uniref:dihydroxy-acid dehydratase domain-containing protein n=1 Tax=Streptomyces sp. NPDC007875 TaxID=3364783 RepID=UPI0036957C95
MRTRAAGRGASHGPAIGHVGPEAASGGPIGLVQDGDTISPSTSPPPTRER